MLPENPDLFQYSHQNINFIFLLKRNLKQKLNATGFILKTNFRNNL